MPRRRLRSQGLMRSCWNA